VLNKLKEFLYNFIKILHLNPIPVEGGGGGGGVFSPPPPCDFALKVEIGECGTCL